MTDKQRQFLQPILDTIESEDIRELAVQLIDDFPPYIWEVGASSTGKYHPQYALGEGIKEHKVYLHRFVLGITNKSVVIDHDDSNKLNNKKENLISMSNEENCYKC